VLVVIHPSGLFEYAIEVPAGGRVSSPWVARQLDPVAPAERPSSLWVAGVLTPVAPTERRLVGDAPTVDLIDFEERPGVQRTRITLTSPDAVSAQVREVSFAVDRGFATMLKPQDMVHVVRNGGGGLGISVLRQGLLVGAAGAVTSVPLGNTISVRRPIDLERQADAIFRIRDHEYRMWECPVEVITETSTHLLHRARRTIGPYEVFVEHGFVDHLECVALTLTGVCPDCAATLTALLLDKPDALQMRTF
jgi:hypothetical protein